MNSSIDNNTRTSVISTIVKNRLTHISGLPGGLPIKTGTLTLCKWPIPASCLKQAKPSIAVTTGMGPIPIFDHELIKVLGGAVTITVLA